MARGWAVLCAGLFGAALGACGDQNLFDSLSDDNTTAAKVESAKIAIDDGNFTQAISILQELCGTSTTAPTCDGETASLLASAFAGRAGVNVFDLIADSGGSLSGTTLASLSIFSLQFVAPTAGEKDDLHQSVEILANLANPTANQSLQMAVYAMADAVVTVGVDLTGGFDSDTGRPNTTPADAGVIQNQTLSQVANDLALVLVGLDESGLGNEDLKDDILRLDEEIDQNQDGDVSAAEMYSFLVNL